jgi:hypothetical protein
MPFDAGVQGGLRHVERDVRMKAACRSRELGSAVEASTERSSAG